MRRGLRGRDYVPLKRSHGGTPSAARECIEAAFGMTKDGKRQVPDFGAVPDEGAGNWSGFLESLKRRGVGNPRLIINDGMAGMPEAKSEPFPDAKRQPRVVHVQTNVSRAVRIRDRKGIAQDLRAVCSEESGRECGGAFSEFVSKWSKPCPKPMVSPVGKQDSVFRFHGFPKAMRRAIYASDAAESLNATARRKTRAGIQYDSEDSVSIVLAKVHEDYVRATKPARFMLEPSEEERLLMGFDRRS